MTRQAAYRARWRLEARRTRHSPQQQQHYHRLMLHQEKTTADALAAVQAEAKAQGMFSTAQTNLANGASGLQQAMSAEEQAHE